MNNTLTEKETAFLTKISKDQYMDGDPTGSTWTECVCDSLSDAGLLGSLVKKGMVWAQGSGREATCGLTQAGLAFLGITKIGGGSAD